LNAELAEHAERSCKKTKTTLCDLGARCV